MFPNKYFPVPYFQDGYWGPSGETTPSLTPEPVGKQYGGGIFKDLYMIEAEREEKKRAHMRLLMADDEEVLSTITIFVREFLCHL